MNKSFPASLAALAALLLAGSALAQTTPSVDARVDRHCPSATLSADAAAPCDDVLNDRPGELPVGARSSGNGTAGSVNTTAGTPTPIIPGGAGTAATGAMGSMGGGSIPGATGTGAVSVGGAASTPARR